MKLVPKKGIILIWIENIFLIKEIVFNYLDRVDLYKIKVKNLALRRRQLYKKYMKILQSGYNLVEPDLALK